MKCKHCGRDLKQSYEEICFDCNWDLTHKPNGTKREIQVPGDTSVFDEWTEEALSNGTFSLMARR